MQRINAAAPLQPCGDLRHAVRLGINHINLRPRRQPVDQGLVIGNACIDKNKALAHGVSPQLGSDGGLILGEMAKPRSNSRMAAPNTANSSRVSAP